MPAWLRHARGDRRRAGAASPGVRVVPDPPQAPMMHLLFDVPAERFAANARRLAEQSGVWTWAEPVATGDPTVVRCELNVGRATCRLTPTAIADILAALIA